MRIVLSLLFLSMTFIAAANENIPAARMWLLLLIMVIIFPFEK